MKTAKYEENKYMVIPWKYLVGIDQSIIDQIADHALKTGFNLESKYYVCNQDEPYADKVLDVILEGETAKIVVDNTITIIRSNIKELFDMAEILTFLNDKNYFECIPYSAWLMVADYFTHE